MYIIYGFPDCHFDIFIYMVSFLGKRTLLEFEVTEIMIQQYFSYIMIVGLIGGWNTNTRENHRPDVSQW
jgi:hypothetical protein